MTQCEEPCYTRYNQPACVQSAQYYTLLLSQYFPIYTSEYTLLSCVSLVPFITFPYPRSTFTASHCNTKSHPPSVIPSAQLTTTFPDICIPYIQTDRGQLLLSAASLWFLLNFQNSAYKDTVQFPLFPQKLSIHSSVKVKVNPVTCKFDVILTVHHR